MVQLLTSLVSIFFILICGNQAEFKPEWCPDETYPSTPDPEWRTIPPRFEIVTELISENEPVVEITQAFSTTRDTIAKNSANTPVLNYWDFQKSEYLKVSNVGAIPQKRPECLRELITSSTKTSIIEEDSLYLKPSVILGFGTRNQANLLWGPRYNTDGVLREIPTKIFKACFYVADIDATVKVTYHVSDVTKFHAYLPSNESIILKLDVNMSTAAGAQKVYTYNVFFYIPNPSPTQERQALETPSGVYCLNRTSDRDIPSNIPDRVSSNAETCVPQFNNAIYSSHNLYDSEFQFSRYESWRSEPLGAPSWAHRTELHDFGVGLVYRYDHTSRQCTVRDITANTSDAVVIDASPNLFQMGDPQHLFLMDDMTYQYTGEKRCRDRVYCDVWIGENELPDNVVEHREWYWAKRINDIPLLQSIPIKLITKRYVSGNLNLVTERSLFNYRLRPMSIFEIDYTLADCYRALGPTHNFNLGVLSFKIENDKKYPVYQNLNYLRLQIWESLTLILFIRPIRISNIIVDQDDVDILVTFTLLDAAPRTGPVEIPLIEPSLDTLIERLTKIIDSHGLAFRARYGTKQVTLRARPTSLNVDHRSAQQNSLTSGPLITGLWIGCSIVGLLLGGIGGFFLFHKLAKK